MTANTDNINSMSDKKELDKIRKKIITEQKKLQQERKKLEKENKIAARANKISAVTDEIKKLGLEGEYKFSFLSKFKQRLDNGTKEKIVHGLDRREMVERVEKMSGRAISVMNSTELEEWRISVISSQIANEWSHEEIQDAIRNGAKGASIHGFLESNYLDYKHLIKNNILSIASYLARKKWLPTPVRLLEQIDLSKFIKTAVELDDEYFFDHLPDQPFKKLILYAPDTLRNSVEWMEEIPETIKGFSTTCNVGYANLIVISWAAWNLPMVLVAHAPGKDYAVYKVELDKKSVVDDTIAQQKKIIGDLRKKVEPLREKSLHFMEGEKSWRKFATNIRDRMINLQESALEKDIKRVEQNTLNTVVPPTTKNKLGSIFIILCVLGFTIAFMYIFTRIGGAK